LNDENPYSTPEAVLVQPSIVTSSVHFFPTSQLKLAVLYLVTFGLYPVYWFYKHWTLQKKRSGENMIPMLRALFYIFFTHSLFRRISESAKEKNIKITFNASLLATIFVILSLLTNFLGRLTANNPDIGGVDYLQFCLMFVLLWPIYVMQGIANQVNGDPKGELNNSFSIYNYIFIILGSVFLFLAIIGILQSETGILDDFLN